MAPGCHVVGIEDQVAVKVLKQKDLHQEDSRVGHVSSSFFGMKTPTCPTSIAGHLDFRHIERPGYVFLGACPILDIINYQPLSRHVPLQNYLIV